MNFFRYIDTFPFYLYFCDKQFRGNCGVSGYLFGFPPGWQDTPIKGGNYGISSCMWDKRWKTSHRLQMWLLHKPLPNCDPVVEKGRFGRGRITEVQRYRRKRIRQAGLSLSSPAPQQQTEQRPLQRSTLACGKGASFTVDQATVAFWVAFCSTNFYYKTGKKDSPCKRWGKKENIRQHKTRSVLKKAIFAFKAACSPWGLCKTRPGKCKYFQWCLLEGTVLWQEKVCPSTLAVQHCPWLRVPLCWYIKPPGSVSSRHWAAQGENGFGKFFLWEKEPGGEKK